MLWDLFCHVVDNFGDLGVCWRAAADLASRGEQVRLWTDDDAGALAWLAPGGHAGVAVHPWQEAAATMPGDVVIEAFGCALPDAFVARMARAAQTPVWINLEYLSAESYVERSHGLPSPQPAGPGAGLTKWFFYPGFTAHTGGLLREPGLIESLRTLERDRWLAGHGIATRAGERLVSVFCYERAPLPSLLNLLDDAPTLLLCTPGPASAWAQQALGPSLTLGHVRAAMLSPLPQTEYDRLLAACDLNVVRGEDSFVRAQWAAKPFIWHIYAQADGAHAAKLQAFLDLYLACADAILALKLQRLWHVWNGLARAAAALPPTTLWRGHAERWRETLLDQPDLITQLISFVKEKR